MLKIRYLVGSALVVALFTVMATVVYAAPIPGATDEIQGTIKDALGRPLPGASLVLKSSDETVIGKTRSDADGHFVFSNVAPGIYAILAEKTGFQTSTAIATVEVGTIATTTLTMTAEEALEVTVVAERLNQARNGLSPKTGGSIYRIDQKDVDALPEGDNTPFNQVLLQAPGVANDSFGQLHVRGDHANLQYRINGVILPEGISGFGQALDTRFVDRVDLLTGALPAQYGLRTAGVIEIDTKANPENGGRIDLYGGSHNTVQPSLELGGAKEKFTYYLTGSYLGDNLGIENPTASHTAIHDDTEQSKWFGNLSYLITPTSRISLMFGSYDGWFHVPNNPGQVPDPNGQGFLAQLGIAGFNSASLNERQYENNRFGALAFQSSIGSKFDYQVSYVIHYTSVQFTPDPIGDLVFNGVAANIFRSSFSNGLQGDGSYHLNDAHTIRTGFFASDENIVSNNTSTVFPTPLPFNPTGPVGGPPETITNNNPKNGNILLSYYLQDEWKPIDKLTVNYGLRYDHMDAFVEADQWSPRFGLIYKVLPETTLHAAYARDFTPPPTELVSTGSLNAFNYTTNAGSSSGNSPVKPERSHYFDVGATQKIGSGLSLGVDGFYKIVTDLIDEGQFGQALIFTPFNYSQGKIYGVELTGNYRQGDFTAYANLARTVSLAKNVESGQFEFTQADLNYIANNWVHTDHDQLYTFSGGISYRLWGTLFSSDATYGSGLRAGDVNQFVVPANFQLNLGAKRKFDLGSFGPVEARFAIDNVLDRANVIREGSGIGVFAPQYGPRIGFFGGISKTF